MKGLSCLTAGHVPLLQSLRVLANQQQERWARDLIKRVSFRVSAGLELSRSLGAEPNFISKFLGGIILLGEETGELAKCLFRAEEFLEKEWRLKRKIQAILTYPAFLCGLTLVCTILLMRILVPAFFPFLYLFQSSLPFSTRLILFFSRIFSSRFFWLVLLGLVTLTVHGIPWFFKKKKIRFLYWDALVLSFPLVGKIFKKGMAIQTTWTLASSVSAGLPIMAGLVHLEAAATNGIFKRFFQNSRLALIRGETLSSYFLREKEMIPPIVGHLMAVAEATGSTERLLLKCSQFLEDEMDFLIERFSNVLEPALLTVIGGVILFILLSIFTPAYNLTQVRG